MSEDNVIAANTVVGEQNWEWLNQWPAKDRLIKFGIGQPLIDEYLTGNHDFRYWGGGLSSCLVLPSPAMWRLKPNGVTRLGLYIHDIIKQLRGFWDKGTIVDFGCGPWIDATLSLVKDSKFKVQLIDINPLPLAFSSWQLDNYGIPNTATLVPSLDDEASLLVDDVIMIVESTAFEHVRGIRQLFEPLMKRLPRNGLFLTNYTRIDWTNPAYDGEDESDEFAPIAVNIALSLADRYKWEPDQCYWDLWRIK